MGFSGLARIAVLYWVFTYQYFLNTHSNSVSGLGFNDLISHNLVAIRGLPSDFTCVVAPVIHLQGIQLEGTHLLEPHDLHAESGGTLLAELWSPEGHVEKS